MSGVEVQFCKASPSATFLALSDFGKSSVISLHPSRIFIIPSSRTSSFDISHMENNWYKSGKGLGRLIFGLSSNSFFSVRWYPNPYLDAFYETIMLDFEDEKRLGGRWGGRFGNWKSFVEFESNLVGSERDFVNLEMNFGDSKVDFVDLGASFVDLETGFVGLTMGLGNLEMNIMDLETDFVVLEMDFVGLGMDFVDGKHLGYFLNWCFG
ncbi:hypothetical protein CQW23_24092 [Capsicum baccatum]|uniref:Uncharacterized protein n=1 Tax=Capsicum baccatum TaxID=33114 RepID=A0A2G2VTV5_CAPBA|nr:hypothetical protein CQW23_24092 [Capsicum baccatum]